MGQQYLSYKIWEGEIVAIIHIYGGKSIFYNSVLTKKLNLSSERYEVAYIWQELVFEAVTSSFM